MVVPDYRTVEPNNNYKHNYGIFFNVIVHNIFQLRDLLWMYNKHLSRQPHPSHGEEQKCELNQNSDHRNLEGTVSNPHTGLASQCNEGACNADNSSSENVGSSLKTSQFFSLHISASNTLLIGFYSRTAKCKYLSPSHYKTCGASLQHENKVLCN